MFRFESAPASTAFDRLIVLALAARRCSRRAAARPRGSTSPAGRSSRRK